MFAVLDTNHFREVARGSDLAAAMERRATAARLDLFTTIITGYQIAALAVSGLGVAGFWRRRKSG